MELVRYTPDNVGHLQHKPQLLSSEDIYEIAEESVYPHFFNESIPYDKTYIDENITGIKLNGVNLLFIRYDHQYASGNEDVSYYHRAFISSPATSAVVVEYFYPEIAQNFKNAKILGKIRSFEDIAKGHNAGRIESAANLAKYLASTSKPIVTIDTANKPLSEAYYYAQTHIPGLSGISIGTLQYLEKNYAESIGAALTGTALQFAFWRYIVKEILSSSGVSSDQMHLSWHENIFLLNEHLRRFYLARGLEALTDEYPPLPTYGKDSSNIVVLYPPAHSYRAMSNILYPNPVWDNIKSRIGRVTQPGIDFSVRTWKYTGGEAGNPLHDWAKISETDLPHTSKL